MTKFSIQLYFEFIGTQPGGHTQVPTTAVVGTIGHKATKPPNNIRYKDLWISYRSTAVPVPR